MEIYIIVHGFDNERWVIGAFDNKEIAKNKLAYLEEKFYVGWFYLEEVKLNTLKESNLRNLK